MLSPQPFNELGQIDAAGAIQYAAFGILGGIALDKLYLAADKKYGPMTAQLFSEIADIANAGIDAGQFITESNPSELPDQRAIPVVRGLFDDNPEGERTKYATEYTDPITGEKRRIYINSPVPLSLDQILAEAIGTLSDYMSRSPGGFEGVDKSGLSRATLKVLYAFSDS